MHECSSAGKGGGKLYRWAETRAPKIAPYLHLFLFFFGLLALDLGFRWMCRFAQAVGLGNTLKLMPFTLGWALLLTGLAAALSRRLRQVWILLIGLIASLLCVTHDLYFAKKIATHIHVMYAGQILESSGCEAFFQAPLHPYSQMMINSLPEHGFQYPKGFAPSHEEYDGLGCRFAGRCPKAQAGCFREKPPVLAAGERQVRCHHVSQSR